MAWSSSRTSTRHTVDIESPYSTAAHRIRYEDEVQALSPAQKPKIERQLSLMGKVHSRIEKLQDSSPVHFSERHSEKRVPRMARQAMTMTMGAEMQQEKMAEPRCKVSFGAALLMTMVLVILLTCASFYIPLEIYRHRLNQHFDELAHDNTEAIRGILQSLVAEPSPLEDLRAELASLAGLIQLNMWEPLNASLADSWKYMQKQHAWQAGWEGKLEDEAQDIENHSLHLLMQAKWSHDEGRHSQDILWLTTDFESGQQITVSVQMPSFENQSLSGNSSISLASSIPKSLFEPVDAGHDRVCRGTGASDNLGKYWVLAEDGYINSLADCQAACVSRIGCVGVEYENKSLRCELWIRPEGIESSLVVDGFECYSFSSGPPGYAIQKAQAFFHPQAPLQQMWSEVWIAEGKPRISTSLPVAYCGSYACFDGVITATSTLRHVSRSFTEKWQHLRKMLPTVSPAFVLSPDTSALFAIVLTSRFPEEEGLLLGTEEQSPSELIMASESKRQIINTTAFVLKQRYGRWSVQELQQERFFSFGLREAEANGTKEARYESCDSELAVAEFDANCMKVGTVPVSLDSHTQWLLVMVLPVVSYSPPPKEREQLVSAANLQVDALRAEITNLGDAYLQSFIIFPVIAALSVCIALALACGMSYPLRQLDSRMQQLAEFNSTGTSVKPIFHKRPSPIIEVSNLQHTFGRLSDGIEAFTRFVPETVVRRIVRGDPRAARLHVTRREVTIMFSDIRDFTAISESLSEEDLLFVLTRYLSVMTRLVEDFNGIVTEVLGDGLLAFWNTPDDLEEHAAKACDAALAQQQAIAFLNQEFASFNLPSLQIRIGLHTGSVLSGNLGSESKMKFGCLGDPINLASRLEGLCKFYGVGVICSSDTRAALPQGHFFCRRLDIVQVKGRREATEIFEVVGQDKDRDHAELSAALAAGGAQQCVRSSTVESALDAIGRSTVELSKSSSHVALEKPTIPVARELSENSNSVSEEVRSRVEMYETALAAWQSANFLEACRIAAELLQTCPEDVAASRLLERSRQFVSADGKSVVGISKEELDEWKGVFVMTEK